jgi:hypothetical protein
LLSHAETNGGGPGGRFKELGEGDSTSGQRQADTKTFRIREQSLRQEWSWNGEDVLGFVEEVSPSTDLSR